MNRHCSAILACATLVFSAEPAYPDTADGQYSVRGAALTSCAVYEAAREARSEVYRAIAAWMDGYITGINQTEADTYDVASFESAELLTALVSEQCKASPRATVFSVVNSIVQRFATSRLREQSEKVEVVVGDYQVFLYGEVIRRIQQKLADLGHYDGVIEDEFNDQAIIALQAYQQSIAFQPTGFPDQLTLWRLFTDP